MSRKPILPAGRIAGGIAVVLIIVVFAVILGGCTNPLSGGGGPATATPTPSSQPSVTPTPAATQGPTAPPTLLPTPTPTPTSEPTIAPEEITRMYEWRFNNQSYSVYFGLLKSDYDLYKSKPHARGSDYAGYRISPDEHPYFVELTLRLMDAVDSTGLSNENAAAAVVAFLQSLPHVSPDSVAYDDYPKYPIETLIDGGGDSEDMSILAANLLDEMGYDAVLLGFPGHMAVGVQCPNGTPGRHYPYNGHDYYYLETMPPYRALGDIPDQYRNTPATIYTMQGAAGITLDMNASQESSDELYVYYHVHCNVANGGTQTAENVSVYFAALALNYGEDRVWDPAYEINLGDIPAGAGRTAEATLKIPRSGPTQIECIASGDNFDPVPTKGERFSL